MVWGWGKGVENAVMGCGWCGCGGLEKSVVGGWGGRKTVVGCGCGGGGGRKQ